MMGQMPHSGLEVVGELPWGTHFCQFYETPQDLLEVLVGYFQQGLQNNEFCMWITSEALAVEEAKLALRTVVPDLDERILLGQIEFVDYRQWYFPEGHFDGERVLQGWVEKERTVLARGYEGMRLTENLSWLKKDHWKAFSDYEANVNAVIGSHRMLALCTYSLDKCRGVEMLDVFRNHPLALVKKEGKWEAIQNPQLRKATEQLQKSEQRQKAILDAVPDLAWLKDKEGRYLAVNAAWCRFFGMNSTDTLGKTAFELLAPEVAAKFEELDHSIVLSGRLSPYEELLTDKDGRKVWFETFNSPLFNDSGEFLGTTGLARDITARKHIEELLRENEERLRLAAQAANFGTYDCDLVANTLYWSPELKAIWGLRPDDPCPTTEEYVPLGVHPDDRANVKNTLNESLNPQGNGLLRIEHRIVRPDGAVRWVLAHGRVYFSGDGETRHAVRAVGTFLDITERKQAEERLQVSEATLREAQELASLGSYRLDIPQGRWTSSEVLDRILDIPADYARTVEGWGNLVHPDERQAMLDYFRNDVFGKHKRFDREYRIVRYGDNQVRWVHGLGRLEFDATGHPIAMLGTIQDITERKLAEELLRQSEERYRFMVEAIPLGGWMCDAQGRNTYVSPSFLDKLGMTAQQAQEFGWANALMPDDLGEPLDRWRDCMRTGKDWEGEWHFRMKDGTYRTALSRGRVIRDSQGQIIGWVGVDLDITDRKRAEQEKLEMERRLLHAQKLESLGILAGGIAHDFNNILAGIMGYAELAKARLPSSEPAQEDLDVIKTSVRRAAALTRQMLAYSGKGKFIVEPVSLSKIVKDMRAMLEMSISKKAVLNCKLDADLPMIEADASQIHQIILNLVINASEALGDESGVIVISTDAIQCSVSDCAAFGGGNDLRAGLYVRLEVTDTGCGMDEETLAKIFDPFFTTKFTGRGLGLAAVHGILRGHRGGIRVSSKLGEGTTFQVFFPVIETSPAILADESIPAKPWHGEGIVLVVDDEEIIRRLAKRMIETAGFSVLTAKDGEEAVRLFREHQNEVACVLLDLTMPKMSGEETFRAIRQISPGIRVILSSGYSEEAATGRFSGMGLAGFIQKPYQLDTMIATLRDAVTPTSKAWGLP